MTEVWVARLLVAWLLFLLPAAHAQQPTPKKPRPTPPLVSKAPAQSEALRAPTRHVVPRPRPDTVPLPFNMVWGDTENRLNSLFAGVGATVAKKKTEGRTETWTVQGLLAADLQASVFTFQEATLAAMEFDYGKDEWDTAKYNDKMGQLRRLLESQFGAPGEMVSRPGGEEPPPAPDGVKQSLMGYQWRRGDTLAQLFYFAAEDPGKGQAFRSISVHYHYQDPGASPMMSAEDAAPLPGMENANPDANPLFGGKVKSSAATLTPAPLPEPSAPPPPVPVPTPEPTPTLAPSLYVAPDVEPTPFPEATPEPGGGKGKAKGTPRPYDPLPQ